MGVGQLIRNIVTTDQKAVANGIATLDSNVKIPKNQIDLTASDVGAIAVEADPTVSIFTKGLTTNDSILTALNASSGLISSDRLPSYVDDVLSYAAIVNFPVAGETSKIYVAEDTNKIYRWSGSSYVEISSAATADTALKLSTPRTISTTGDATYSVSFDGSTNVSSAITLANSGVTAGTYNNSATQVRPFTVDAKGRITSVGTAVTIAPAWTSIAGKPTTLSGFGITDAQPLGDELTAIQALADTAGFLKKTSNGVYSIDSNSYLTANQTIAVSGDATGSGTTNISLTLAASGVTAGTYNNSATQVRPFAVDAKGRITGVGTPVDIAPPWSAVTGKPTTLNEYGITDALNLAGGNVTGNLGLGVSSPTVKLSIGRLGGVFSVPALSGNTAALITAGGGVAASGSFLSILGGNTSQVAVTFGDSDAAEQGGIYYNNSTDTLDLRAGNSNRISISSGTTTFFSTTTSTSTTTGAICAASLGITGAIFAGSLNGNGSGLTALNASSISTGTLSAARLPASYLPLTGGTLTGTLNTNSAIVSTSTATSTSTTTGAITAASLGITGAIFTGTLSSESISAGATITIDSKTTYSNILSIGSSTNASTPCIDFNSGATLTDYDSRISASGGTGVAGGGSLTFTCSNNTFTGNVAINGKILNTLAIGDAVRSSSIGLSLEHTLHANAIRASVQGFLILDDTAALSADRTNRGGYFRVDNLISGSNKGSFVHNIFGLQALARNGTDVITSGAASGVYGIYSIAQNRSNDAITMTNLVATQNYAVNSGSADINTMKGAYNLVQMQAASTSSQIFGSHNVVQTNSSGAVATVIYGCSNSIENLTGTITTAYGIYNNFSGTIGTKWGIYSTGDSKNYLTGSLGLGIEDPAYKLDVVGSAKVSGSYFVGSNQVVSARRTGWAAPTGTATRTTFATSTVTLPQLAERVKALIDDLTTHGLIGA